MNKLQAAPAVPRRYMTNFVRQLKFTLSALAIGSRTVALADNSQLVRDLAARAAYLYGRE